MSEAIRRISEDEKALLTHTTMFGSDGYPIRKLGRGWYWDFRSLSAPEVYKTKRECLAAFERFIDVLVDASGENAQWDYIRENGAPAEHKISSVTRAGFELEGLFAFTAGPGRHVVKV